jgi:hypothetical protein
MLRTYLEGDTILSEVLTSRADFMHIRYTQGKSEEYILYWEYGIVLKLRQVPYYTYANCIHEYPSGQMCGDRFIR